MQPFAVADDRGRRLALVDPALAEQSERDRVERARLDVVAQAERSESPAQLAGGLTGERQRQRVPRVGGLDGHPVRDAPRQHPRLAGTGGGDHRDERRRGRDGGPLLLVEIAEQVGRFHPVDDRRTMRAIVRSPATSGIVVSRPLALPLLFPRCRIRRSCSTTTRSSQSIFTRTGGTSPRPCSRSWSSIVIGIIVLGTDESWLKWIALALIVASAGWLLIRYLKWATTNFVITSDRVIFRHGVVAKSGIEIPLERVNSVHFNQSVFERMIGAGDLLIESGAEGGQQRFTDVHNPDKIQNLIHSQMELNEDRMFKKSGATAPQGIAGRRRPDDAARAARSAARPRHAHRRRVRGPEATPARRVSAGRGGRPRVVSLVPSATETLLALGADVVACTRFCNQPLPTVGGTKNPDVAAIVALAPDVVVVDTEENRREDADALEAAGLHVVATSVRSVDDALAVVGRLAVAAGTEAPVVERLGDVSGARLSAFVPIWRRPWMTVNGSTYGASLLGSIGVDLVTADLATEYPTVDLDDIARLAPDVVLVPSEPYSFARRPHRRAPRRVPDVADRSASTARTCSGGGSRTPAAHAASPPRRDRRLVPGTPPDAYGQPEARAPRRTCRATRRRTALAAPG